MESSIYGICNYDFEKETNQELDCQQNDILSLLCYLNDDWVIAKNTRTTKIGMIPTSFVSLNNSSSSDVRQEIQSKIGSYNQWKQRNSDTIESLLSRKAFSNPENSMPKRSTNRDFKSMDNLPDMKNTTKEILKLTSARAVACQKEENVVTFTLECIINGQVFTMYRAYDEFFYMHLALKSAFPQERNSNRRLPLMPVPSDNLSTYAFEKRLNDLDKYCSELTKLDYLLKSKYVIEFFQIRTSDKGGEKSIKIQVLSRTSSMAFRTTIKDLSFSSLTSRIEKKLRLKDYELKDRFTKKIIRSTEDLKQVVENNPDKIVLYIP